MARVGMQWRLAILMAAACGRVHGSEAPADAAAGGDAMTSPVDEPLTLELLAGNIGGAGTLDGTGDGARFDRPLGIAVDSMGDLYVADGNSAIIRKTTPAGVVTTFAGTPLVFGSVDGTGTGAQFGFPAGIVIDSADNLFVSDGNNETIRKITPAGMVTTFAGGTGQEGASDGTGAAARFLAPTGIAIDSADNLYVADQGNNTIRKITPAAVVTTIAGTAGVHGSADGTGAAAQFDEPTGVAVDGAGNVYVADQDNSTIRQIAPGGVVTTLAGTAGTFGSSDGRPGAFTAPTGVAVDATGNVFVADTQNDTIRKVNPTTKTVTTIAGAPQQPGSDNGGVGARFNNPSALAFDRAGNLYIADTFNNTIRKFTTAGVVTTVAGAAVVSGSTDGAGADARFDFPNLLATDPSGTVYVTDDHTIRKITPDGVVSTLAGSPGNVADVDGVGAAAGFGFAFGVAVDRAGTLFVTEGGTSLRKITPDGMVTTLAGSNHTGSVDGTGAAAQFERLYGVATDATGNIFVADDEAFTIRQVTPQGVVTTLAGHADLVGDTDGGTTGRFDSPQGLASDAAGNLYVAQQDNTIRAVTPDGVVSTLAGTPGKGASDDGTGAAARFNEPEGVAVDSAGNVYVADFRNHVIRKVTPAGVTTTIGSEHVLGIGLGTTPSFGGPQGLAISGDSLVISDGCAILLLRHVVR